MESGGGADFCLFIFIFYSEARRKAEEAQQRADMLGQRLREEMVRFKKAKVN